MHADNYTPNARSNKPDLIVFSHLRWDFVYQRPQHLLKRSARDRRVFFVEEPVFDNGSMCLDVSERENNLKVVVPHLPEGLCSEVAKTAVLHDMVRECSSITIFISTLPGTTRRWRSISRDI